MTLSPIDIAGNMMQIASVVTSGRWYMQMRRHCVGHHWNLVLGFPTRIKHPFIANMLQISLEIFYICVLLRFYNTTDPCVSKLNKLAFEIKLVKMSALQLSLNRETSQLDYEQDFHTLRKG